MLASMSTQSGPACAPSRTKSPFASRVALPMAARYSSGSRRPVEASTWEAKTT